MANDLLDKISRRNFVKTSGTGALAALAGCSTQDGSSADTTSSNDDSTSTQAEGTGFSGDGTINDTDEDATEQPENTQSEENVLSGEEVLEGAYEEAGGFWMQFNDTASQLESPYQSSLLGEVPAGFDLENQTFTGDSGTIDMDAIYVTIFPENQNDDGEYDTGIAGLDAGRYNEDESFEQNRGNGAVKINSTGYAGEEEIELFFEEDVNSYSDIIEDIPDEVDEFV
jgi:hypothetical protein